MHWPLLQKSPVVQEFPSLHAPPLLAAWLTHWPPWQTPLPQLLFTLLQSIGLPLQAPVAQESSTVHGLPSSQEDGLGADLHEPLSQTPTVHGPSKPLQLLGLPKQAPSWQMS